ncbi:MAG: Uma2 family endonuclease [Chloroflexi bacterium]|nr:Uma2 family endonuclease [Chloroflexota bacterium]
MAYYVQVDRGLEHDVREHLVTVDAFEGFIARPENRDRLFELVNGEIIEKRPTEEHGVVTGNIYFAIRLSVEVTGVGRVVVEVCHRVPGDPHNDRVPDVAYYADASRPVVKQGPVLQMPDLVVEVKSPRDTCKAMRDKAPIIWRMERGWCGRYTRISGLSLC